MPTLFHEKTLSVKRLALCAYCCVLAGMAEESTPLLLPATLLKDRWEVHKKIGGGGFGEIYKAKDHTTGQVCRQTRYFFNMSKSAKFQSRRGWVLITI